MQRSKNFDGEISRQQGRIIEQLGHNVTSDKQFVDSVNELVRDLKLGKTATTVGDVEAILKLIGRPAMRNHLTCRSY